MRQITVSIAALNRPVWRLTALFIMLVGLFMALRIYMGREAEDRLIESDIIAFSTLSVDNMPGGMRFLVCPIAYCNRPPDLVSPVYPISWEALRNAWSEMVARQKKVKLLAGDDDLMKITYVQHTKILNFPDIITVAFVPIDAGHATLAIESHSRYGSYDFGTNETRVREWLKKLDKILSE